MFPLFGEKVKWDQLLVIGYQLPVIGIAFPNLITTNR